MGDKYVPLTGQLLDEGEFMEDLNAELSDAQHALILFVRQYGEKAKEAKCKLTIEIVLKCESVESEAFSVARSMKRSDPKRPTSISMGMAGETDKDGRLALFVKASGSDEQHPKTGKLFTRDGDVIKDGERVKDDNLEA